MAFADEIIKHQGERRVFLDFSVANNPGVDWEGAVTRLYGSVPDNQGPIPVKGTVSTFGAFARSVLNMELDLETPSVTVELYDEFNEWRRMAEPPSTQIMYRWIQYMVRVVAPDTSIFDQRVAVGQIVDPQFPADKKVRLTLQLSPGNFLGEMLPRRLVTLRDFPRAAPENVGKVVPVVYGVMSNQVRTVTVEGEETTPPVEDGCGDEIWSDTFESATALSADYSTASNIQKVAGIGVSGSQGLRVGPASGSGRVMKAVDTGGRVGCLAISIKPQAGNNFSWFIQLDDSSTSVGFVEITSQPSGAIQVLVDGTDPTQTFNAPAGSIADGVFSVVRVEWRVSTWTGPGASDHAADGYLQLYVNGVAVVNQTNIELHREVARQAVVDNIYIGGAIVGGVASAVFDNFTVNGSAAAEPEPTTLFSCTPTDTGTGPNMTSGALRAILVDVGITTTISVQNPAPDPGNTTIDTSIEAMGTGTANEQIGSGSINVPTWFYIAPMVGGQIGPLSSIMDLDQSFDPDYPAHNAVISWNDITTTPDQWIVWMFTDFSFHPVSNPSPGARVKIISGTPYTDPDWPPANTFDYQVIFTSVDDGDAWEPVPPLPEATTAFSGYRYLLAGHYLRRVLQVYVRRPVAIPSTEPGGDPVTEDMQVLQQEGTDFVQEVIEVNGNRYHTIRFFAAQQSDDCTQQYEVTANVEGIETNSDGTGTLITNGIEMVEHILLNWVFNDYRSSVGIFAPPGGRWFTDVPYAPGLLDHTSFLTAYENSFTFVVGGYQGAGMMTEQQTGTALLSDLIRSFGLDFYFEPLGAAGNGAWFVKLFNPDLASRAGLVELHPHPPTESGYVGINAGSFELRLAKDLQCNVIPYFGGPMYGRGADSGTNEDGGYTASGEVRDPESIQAYGTLVREPLMLPWTRDPETTYSVAYRLLRMVRYPPIYASCKTPPSGILLSLASEVLVTHPDGTGITGWSQRLCRVVRHITDYDALDVTLTLRDVDGLVP